MPSAQKPVCIVVLLGALFACRSSPQPAVAQVGSQSISLAELESRLQEAPPEFQEYAASPAGRRQFLNVLIREKVVLQEARRAGLEREDAYKTAVSRYKAQLAERLNEYADTLLVNSYLRKLGADDLAVAENETRHYYDEHRADFAQPAEIQASHILVSTPERAAEVLNRLKKGEPFEQVARELSEDPTTAASGGKLAPFVKGLGSGLKEVEDEAARLPVGQISKPIQTAFGYHIIKKTAERRLKPRSYEDAKEDIRTRLEKQKFDQWVSAKQAALGVHVNESALATVHSSASPQEPSQQ